MTLPVCQSGKQQPDKAGEKHYLSGHFYICTEKMSLADYAKAKATWLLENC